MTILRSFGFLGIFFTISNQRAQAVWVLLYSLIYIRSQEVTLYDPCFISQFFSDDNVMQQGFLFLSFFQNSRIRPLSFDYGAKMLLQKVSEIFSKFKNKALKF